METSTDKHLEQEKRTRLVFVTISLFVLLMCLFLFLLDKSLQGENLSFSFAHTLSVTTEAAPTFTSSPFQPETKEPIVAGGERTSESLVLVVTPSPTNTALILQPTATQMQILEPKTEGTAFPLYVVQVSDHLTDIAGGVNVPLETLRSANFMYGDSVVPGQVLIIPPPDYSPEPRWRFASLDKDQANIFYPLSFDTDRYRLHYMPNTLPAVDPMAVSGMVNRGVQHIESTFGKPLSFYFDAYVAGTLYEPPNSYLLGRSFSLDRKVFILYNGSGDATIQQYLITHELTHLYAWNTFGQPVSFLVSEGAAVYTGMKMIADSPYMPIKTFCAVYKVEEQLPWLFTKTELGDFRGHNNNLVNYYSTGCFVGYLIETYGTEMFGQLYGTQDYEGIYGKTLEQLEIEWRDSIVTEGVAEQIDTRRFVTAVDTFMSTNESFFTTFNGSKESILAYQALDKARLALLAGDLDEFDQRLQAYYTMVNQ